MKVCQDLTPDYDAVKKRNPSADLSLTIIPSKTRICESSVDYTVKYDAVKKKTFSR